MIGDRLRAARLAEGLSIEAAARAAGMHRNTLARIEAGECDVGATKLADLCRALGVSADTMLGNRECECGRTLGKETLDAHRARCEWATRDSA